MKRTRQLTEYIQDTFGDSPEEAHSEPRCVNPPIGCGKPITGKFTDELSYKEYTISGLCQECQDKFFNQEEEE